MVRKSSTAVEETAPVKGEKTRGQNRISARGGWEGLKATKAKSSKNYGDEIKFPENEEVLIKFLDPTPFTTYNEHWVNEITEGRRSFICLDEDCPLCDAGHDPSRYQALFNIIDLTNPSKPVVKIWKASAGPVGEIEKRAESKLSSPIDRDDLYFLVKRYKAKNNFWEYEVSPVEDTQLQRLLGVEPLTSTQIDELAEQMLGEEEAVKFDTKAELREVVSANFKDR